MPKKITYLKIKDVVINYVQILLRPYFTCIVNYKSLNDKTLLEMKV